MGYMIMHSMSVGLMMPLARASCNGKLARGNHDMEYVIIQSDNDNYVYLYILLSLSTSFQPS